MRISTRTGISAVGCSVLTLGLAGMPQSLQPAPEFEAASVKPASPTPYMRMMMSKGGGPGTSDPGRISYTNTPLQVIVQDAYGVRKQQLAGPSWLETARFDLAAKLPNECTKEQFKTMLQRLLAEQFSLALHHEQRDLPVYALLTAKGGPKMNLSSGARAAVPPIGFPQLPPGQNAGLSGAMGGDLVLRVTARKQTVADLAEFLNRSLDRPVVDASGLPGAYDFTLEFVAESVRRADGTPSAPQQAAGDSPAPTVYSAVQEQLGLRLEPRKMPFDVLVIDRIEKVPRGN